MVLSRLARVPLALCCAFMPLAGGAYAQAPGTTVLVTASMRDVFETTTAEPTSLDIARTTVSAKQIAEQNARTLTEALEYTPGALTETRGRKVRQFTSFRGQRYPYPDYAINGIWQREFHEMPYFYPASQVESIEVVRSAAGLLMGMSTLNGVINIIPKRYEAPTTYAEAEYGTLDSFHGYLFNSGALPDGGYALGLGHNRTEGPSGQHAAEAMSTFALQADHQATEDLALQATVHWLYGRRELARAEEPAPQRLQATDEAFDPYDAVMVTLRGLHKQAERSATEVMFYGSYRSHDFESTTPGTHVSTEERDYELGVQLIQALALREDNILRAGMLYNRWVAPHGKRFYVGKRTDLHTLSAVLVDEHDFGALEWNGGVRYNRTYNDEYGAFNINGSSGAFGSVDPVENEWDEPVVTASTGLRYELASGVHVYANLAGGSIEPRSGSLDEDLREPETERRTMVDGGVRMRVAGVGTLSLGGFAVYREDAILLSGAVSTNAEGRVLELYRNRDQRQYGLEAEIQSEPLWDAVTAFANATVMESEEKQAGSYRSDATLPDVIVAGGIRAQVGRFDCNALVKHVSPFENSRFSADGTPQPLGGYVEADLIVGYTMGREAQTRVYTAIENLTDEEFSTVVGYPDYGTRINAGIQHTF